MPPKLSKSEKLNLIVAHLKSTGTCHTLKDLEKSLPAVASINSIQVKDFIQELIDENKIRVEKIGSGNWYWCFDSDDRADRERHLARVRADVDKARKGCADAEAGLAAELAQRQQDSDDSSCDAERAILQAQKTHLQEEIRRLCKAESSAVGSMDRKGASQLQTELEDHRQQALRWTDNIYILEEYMRKLAGGDRQLVDQLLRQCYGDEYVEGEGLREL
ncbi:hypothetical protein N7539_006560 [Penicillium diatomitis]|uniref:Meiotic nuclear division protein 1 n=1 Tax=Penicillium diatomitis TaxID=2819901 RepID=A0A9X0BSI8_9EURO|nr:uncharacterized protein N7539_006560 [Penicillium diatomitis]KAJ5480666.1 hypothetical protein N7539_006560 [Penicillium diatomitis]